MDGFQKALYEKLQVEGMNIDKAAEIAVAQNFAPQAPTQSPAPALPTSDYVKNILEDTGLSNDDPDVIAVKNRYSNPADIERELYRVAFRRTKPTSPAALVQPQTKQGSKDLASQYDRELSQIPRGTPGLMMRTQLKIKYRNQGYDPDHPE